MKKNKKANNSFLYKNRKLLFFSFLFVLSIGISIYFVFANDDSDQNKFTVTGVSPIKKLEISFLVAFIFSLTLSTPLSESDTFMDDL